jgi:hypothetical protein
VKRLKNITVGFLSSCSSSIFSHSHQLYDMNNIDPNSAVYATDEYGRPFIILREGQRKARVSGIEAIRVSRTLLTRGSFVIDGILSL